MSTSFVANTPPPATQHVLTVNFQGICAFLRNNQQLQNTTEVTVVFVAGERAGENPPLCTHTPVLVFNATDFLGSTGQVTHTTALVPNSGNPGFCPALGIWPLSGRDVRIVGAPAGDLSLDSSLGKSFAVTADLDLLLQGHGAASPDCLAPQPPATRLVGGRMFLTSGNLSVSARVGASGQPGDQWVFDDEASHPTSGTVAQFAQEVQYDFSTAVPTDNVAFEAGPMGFPANETLVLTAGAKVAISQLCPIDLGPINDERDFLAYYALLASSVSPRLIPHRLLAPNGGPIRIGVSACPPTTTYI